MLEYARSPCGQDICPSSMNHAWFAAANTIKNWAVLLHPTQPHLIRPSAIHASAINVLMRVCLSLFFTSYKLTLASADLVLVND